MRLALASLVLLLFPFTLAAQDKPCKARSADRPSVGLALEGGVALGLAHVGVIQWLEENHIPVDCIAGTSMGALVGGLYAMGYGPHPRGNEQPIKDFLKRLDWNGVFLDRIDYSHLTFMRKGDLRTYPTSLEFRFSSGFRLPEGLNPGHRVGLVFDRLAWPYSKLNTFNDLNIPFRCVSTDVNTAKADVLGDDVFFDRVGADGGLSEALRSTMSLPGYFSPVIQHVRTRCEKAPEEKTEKRYVDGGLLKNLPVEVLVGMGADIVISIHLDDSSASSSEDLSFTRVIADSVSVITSANERASLDSLKNNPGSAGKDCIPDTTPEKEGLGPYHLPLTIRVGQFNVTDFDKWRRLEKQGFEDAAHSFAVWEASHGNCLKRDKDAIARLFDLAISKEMYDLYRDERAKRLPPALVRREPAEKENRGQIDPYYPASAEPRYVTISATKVVSCEKLSKDPRCSTSQCGPGQNRSIEVADPDLENFIRRSLSCTLRNEKGPQGQMTYRCPKYVPEKGKDETRCKKQLAPAAPVQLAMLNTAGPAVPVAAPAAAEPAAPFQQCHAGNLEEKLNRMVGTGRFARLGYHMRSHNDEQYLEINAKTQDSSPILIKPVIAVDGSDYANPIFALGARFTAFDVGPLGSELRGEVLLGSRYGFGVEYYQPVFGSASSLFVAPRATAESSPFNIYQSGDQLARYQLRTVAGGLDVGYNFGRIAQLRLGYEGGGIKLSRTLGANIFPFTADRIGASSLKFSLDGLKFFAAKLEAPVMPRDGAAFSSTFQWHDGWLGASNHFPTAAAELSLFQHTGKSGSVFLKADGGSTLGYSNDGLPVFSLGGPQRLAAYGPNEFLTNQYAHASAGYIQRVYRFETLGGAIYVTGYFELAKAYGLPTAPTLPKDGTAGVVLNSLVGPLFLGGSLGDSGHKKIFFYMGRVF